MDLSFKKHLFLGLLLFASVCLVLLLLTTKAIHFDIKVFFGQKGQGFDTTWHDLPCDWRVDHIPRPTRHRAVVECTNSSAQIFYEEVPFNTTPAVTTLESHDPCLAHLAQSTWCNDPGMRVPRLVHYVWFTRRTLLFHTFVSVLSAVRHIRPCLVLFHGDHLPEGPYWHALLQLVPSIVHVRSERPRQIFGHVINVVEHSADVQRLQVLIEYGGIYLDTDQLVLKSLDPKRIYPVVLGIEIPKFNLGNGMIMSEKGAKFLELWHAKYVNFNDKVWAYHSTRVPYLLTIERPDIVHVVDCFFRPDLRYIRKLYRSGELYPWDDLLALHFYARYYLKFFAEGPVQTNSTIGEILRHILYGSKDGCYKEITTKKIDIISKTTTKARGIVFKTTTKASGTMSKTTTLVPGSFSKTTKK